MLVAGEHPQDQEHCHQADHHSSRSFIGTIVTQLGQGMWQHVEDPNREHQAGDHTDDHLHPRMRQLNSLR